MAKRWMSVVLTVSWLGACAAVVAQPPPAPDPTPPQAAPDLPQAPPDGGACDAAPPGAEPSGPGAACDAAPPAAAPACPAPTSIGLFGECMECCSCCPHTRVGVEYLLWYTRGQQLPALVTAGALNDPFPGAIGQPHTTLLYGGAGDNATQHNGARLTFTLGEDCDDCLSLAGSAFILDQRTRSRAFGSNGAVGTPVIARPFFNVNTRLEDADPVALPAIAAGRILIDTPSFLYGGNFDFRCPCSCGENSRVALLLGGRYLALDESLHISESSVDLPGAGVAGNSYFLAENYGTRNRFYGGEIGAEYEYRLSNVVIDLGGTAAFGQVRQTVNTSAFTSIAEPNGIVTTAVNSALYVSPANAGHFTHTRFAVVPEGYAKFGVDLNEYIRFTVGYTFLYLNEAARPADQINRNVNVQPVGGGAFVPLAPFPGVRSTAFWAQGLDVGLRFNY